MTEQITKQELLNQIESERRRLEATLAQLSEEQVLRPGVEGEWSVKDILIHIVVWEQRMIGWVNQGLRGERVRMLPPGDTWDDVDRWNHETYLDHKDDSLPDVLEQFRQSYLEALSAASNVPEDALLEPGYFDWREGEPLWLVVAANTCWHYKEHDESIRAGLEAA